MGPQSHDTYIYLYLLITNYSFTIDFPGVHSQIELTQNHEEITVKQGDEASLICSANVEALGCSFRSPSDPPKPYNLLKGAR